MSRTGKFIEIGSWLEFGVKEERGVRERGMGFHFEVKKKLPGDGCTCLEDIHMS